MDLATPALDAVFARKHLFDLYLGALSVKERAGFPMVGASVERRVFEYTQQVYNDDAVRALICSVCARIRLDTGRKRRGVEFVHGGWLFRFPKGSLQKNLLEDRFRTTVPAGGKPLISWRLTCA